MEISIIRNNNLVYEKELFTRAATDAKLISSLALPLAFLDLDLLQVGKIQVLENFKTLFHISFPGMNFSMGTFMVVGIILCYMVRIDIVMKWCSKDKKKRNYKDFLLSLIIIFGLLLLMLM